MNKYTNEGHDKDCACVSCDLEARGINNSKNFMELLAGIDKATQRVENDMKLIREKIDEITRCLKHAKG